MNVRLQGFYCALTSFAVLGALWFLSLRDCFFSLPIYDSLFWLAPILLIFLGAPFAFTVIRRSRYRDQMVVDEQVIGGRGLGETLYYALFFGLVCGFVMLPFIGISVLGAVYISSVDTVQFSSSIAVRNGRGGCRWNLTFYNRPVEREVTVCAEDGGIRDPLSGETLSFTEKVGVMGARLIDIRREPR